MKVLAADYQRHSKRPISLARVLFFYFARPGFRATVLHRLANQAWRAGHLRLGLVIAAHAVKVTGADIQPGATIGPGLLIQHPVGIVVGAGVVIGSYCTLLQGTTLGEKLMPLDDHSYPIIGDNVTICAGAVLVGAIRIGGDSVIGANSVVLSDIPEGTSAVGAPARVIGRNGIGKTNHFHHPGAASVLAETTEILGAEPSGEMREACASTSKA